MPTPLLRRIVLVCLFFSLLFSRFCEAFPGNASWPPIEVEAVSHDLDQPYHNSFWATLSLSVVAAASFPAIWLWDSHRYKNVRSYAKGDGDRTMSTSLCCFIVAGTLHAVPFLFTPIYFLLALARRANVPAPINYGNFITNASQYFNFSDPNLSSLQLTVASAFSMENLNDDISAVLIDKGQTNPATLGSSYIASAIGLGFSSLFTIVTGLSKLWDCHKDRECGCCWTSSCTRMIPLFLASFTFVAVHALVLGLVMSIDADLRNYRESRVLATGDLSRARTLTVPAFSARANYRYFQEAFYRGISGGGGPFAEISSFCSFFEPLQPVPRRGRNPFVVVLANFDGETGEPTSLYFYPKDGADPVLLSTDSGVISNALEVNTICNAEIIVKG